MELREIFPLMDKLPENERELIESKASRLEVQAGTLLHGGRDDCLGLVIVEDGQLRAYISSEEGREITIYRLFSRDICLFSASCVMSGIQFEVMVEAERNTMIWVIPSEVYRKITEANARAANFTNKVMASRMTDVMWLIEQIMWKSLDRRLAAILLEEAQLGGSDMIHMTHEKIASHLGTAREVIGRMLKYFQSEGLVTLSRGAVKLEDEERLEKLAG